MQIRDKAKADWQAGMKYPEIAKKYEVPLSTVKSWAARYWKKQPDATGHKKNVRLDAKTQPVKKPGAPYGNQNAKGNKGGGPKGNTFAVKHGAYCKIFSDFITPEEQDMLEKMSFDKASLIRHELSLLTMRERWLLERIEKYKNIQSGLALYEVRKDGDETTTTAITTFDFLTKLESELTRVQRTKATYLNQLCEYIEDEPTEERVTDFIDALKKSAGIWSDDE